MKYMFFYRTLFFLVWFPFGSTLTSVTAQNNQALIHFVRSPSLKYAGVGIKVLEVDTWKVVCAYNDHTALVPASTLKTLTTATALELWGPGYRFPTKIACEGTINEQGVLNGNLVIIGSGDPSLGSSCFEEEKSAFLSEWLRAIQKAGIKSVTGDVIAVDNLYGYEGIPNRWIWGDIGNYYASATYGISFFDNTYRLFLQSGEVQTTPSVLFTDPEITGLTFENHLKSASGSSDSAYIYGIPLSLERRLYGTVPSHKSSFSIKGDIPDPGLLLSQTVKKYLQTNGIPVEGESLTSRTKPLTLANTKELYTYWGKSLEEIISVTNHLSNNHFAEHLYHKIGWDRPEACNDHVPTLAARRIASFWKQKGVDTGGLFQYDGSGLSNANALTASTLTSLLIYMQKQSKYADVFYRSLPLAGKEGTVRSFLKGTKLEGNARVKSGSISNVQAFTGYFDKNGKRYAFAILVNNFTGSRAQLKSAMERFLTGL